MAPHHVPLHLVRFGERIEGQIIYNKSGTGFLIEGILHEFKADQTRRTRKTSL